MAIIIQHTYATGVEIVYSDENSNSDFRENTYDTMDEIAEHVCEMLIKHQFDNADVCSTETGEILMIIKRS